MFTSQCLYGVISDILFENHRGSPFTKLLQVTVHKFTERLCLFHTPADHHTDLNSHTELGQETFEDSFVPEDSATSAVSTLASSEVKIKTEVKSEAQEEVPDREKQAGKKSTNAIMEVFAAGMEEIKRQKEERARQSKKTARIRSLQSPERPPKRCVQSESLGFFSLIFEPATAAFITCEVLVMVQVTAAVVKAWISC